MGHQSNNNFIDYNDPRLIQAIEDWDLINFLDTFKVDYKLTGKNIGRNFIGVSPCPNCKDTRYHFAIHKTRKSGSCFICGDPFHPIRIISYFGRMSYTNAVDYLLGQINEILDMTQQVNHLLHSKPTRAEKVKLGIDPLPKSRPIVYGDIEKYEAIQKFLFKRRLNLWHIKRYDIQLSLDPRFRNFIIFPIKIHEKIMSYQMRNILYKRYHNAEHMDQYLFFEDRIINKKPLILVEGFLDLTRIDTFIQCRYPGKLSVTSGGLKSISDVQKKRLTKYKPDPLIVMFDNDSWFNYNRVKDSMPYDVDYVILPKGSDPNSLTWDQLIQVFDQDIKRYI